MLVKSVDEGRNGTNLSVNLMMAHKRHERISGIGGIDERR